MKRLILSIVLLLFAASANAEVKCYGAGCPLFTLSGSTGSVTLPSGQLLLPDGTAAVPSLAFANYPGNGIYSINSAAAGLTLGGLVRWYQSGYDFVLSNPASTYRISTDVILARDAANTLALRNGVNAQAFNIYGAYTDAGNYERLTLKGQSGGAFQIVQEAAGTGTIRAIQIGASSSQYVFVSASRLQAASTDITDLGFSTVGWKELFLTRSIQGSKSKALTEGTETAVTQIAVPQTAGANFADANIEWGVYATDGTDSQRLRGTAVLAAVNKAGTETCSITAGETAASALSAGTLTCTPTCIVGLADAVQFALNCTSSLTQTTLSAQVFVEMLQPNTLTPQ